MGKYGESMGKCALQPFVDVGTFNKLIVLSPKAMTTPQWTG